MMDSKKGKVILAISAAVLLVGFVAVSRLVAYLDTSPGYGKRAEQGYALSEPIIEALERYHQTLGSYPETFGHLIPEYITEESLNGEKGHIDYWFENQGGGTFSIIGLISEDVRIEYWLQEEAGKYVLRFSYAGPGMNWCEYSPGLDWDCEGYW